MFVVAVEHHSQRCDRNPVAPVFLGAIERPIGLCQQFVRVERGIKAKSQSNTYSGFDRPLLI